MNEFDALRFFVGSSRDVYKLLERVKASCQDDAGCWIWRGYLQRGRTPLINIDRKPRTVRRAVFEAVYGRISKDHDVVNVCECSLCCNPDHLKRITKAERRRRNAEARTSRLSNEEVIRLRKRNAKLSIENVREIRLSEELGIVLALRFEVSPSLISAVRRGVAWRESSPFQSLGARAKSSRALIGIQVASDGSEIESDGS